MFVDIASVNFYILIVSTSHWCNRCNVIQLSHLNGIFVCDDFIDCSINGITYLCGYRHK